MRDRNVCPIRSWLLVLPLASAACEQALPPVTPRADLRVSEQIFDIACMRLAHGAYPQDPSGTRFDATCSGATQGLDPTLDAPALTALIGRRSDIVDALDLTFGDTSSRDGVHTFQSASGDRGELDQFLYRLIPLYDDETLPSATRALGDIAVKLAGTDDRARGVHELLAALSQRQGYRPLGENLGFTRAVLNYPALDAASRPLFALLGREGTGHAAWLKLLEATARELGQDSDRAIGQDSWLRVASDLLLASVQDPDAAPHAAAGAPTEPAELRPLPPLHLVQRTDQGNARGDDATPFPVAGRDDPAAPRRDLAGRLSAYRYLDAAPSLLAALLREVGPLLQRPTPEPSALAKLTYGISALIGPLEPRTYTFEDGAESAFTGPNLHASPLLELVHAVAALLRLPETEGLLALLGELLRAHESELAAAIHAGLRIDQLADAHPRAGLRGWDGTASTPSEFWDDLLAWAASTLDRPGQLEAALRAFSSEGKALVPFFTTQMRYKDQVTYPGPRIVAETRHSDTDAARYNAPISWTLTTEVDRTRPDIGMNRSLFQRLASLMTSMNRVQFCSKPGARLSVPNPLGGESLTFPNPSRQPGADPLATTAADLICAPPSSPMLTYDPCGLLVVPDGTAAMIRIVLNRFQLKLQDPQVACLFNSGLAGDSDALIEDLSQCRGFTLQPTFEGFARFAYIAPNTFLSGFKDPILTNHGVPVTEFEPDGVFILEATHDRLQLGGRRATLKDVGSVLARAFDDHELFEESLGGMMLPTHGYRLADLFSVLHMHWPSPRGEPCPPHMEPGNEGCSQRLEPGRPFYAHQSNLVSYEPLIIEADEQLELGAVVQGLLTALAEIWVAFDDANGRPRVVPAGTPNAKDGIRVLADFLNAALTPDASLADRRGKSWTHTNTCVVRSSAISPADVSCEGGRGRILPRLSPLYLVLDALRAADDAWTRPENAERHRVWLQGRRELVDHVLTTDKLDGADGGTYALRARRVRAITLRVLSWLETTVLTELHPRSGDRVAWTLGPRGLAARLERVLAHPIVAHALGVVDALWADPAARDALFQWAADLLDERNDAAFPSVVLAAADALEFINHEPKLKALFQLGSLLLARDAWTSTAGRGAALDVEHGAANALMELARRLLADAGDVERSTLTKLLANLARRRHDSSTPLETLFDAVAEVNRSNPTVPASTPLSAEDSRYVLSALAEFTLDPDHGLERLYAVIRSRFLHSRPTAP